MGLVMEDRSRLEHLMGIAQNLRLKGGKSELHSVASTDRQSFDKPARMPLQQPSDAKGGNGMGLGGGILSALNFSKDAGSQEANMLTEAVSSIPRYGVLVLRSHCMPNVLCRRRLPLG